MVFGWTGKLLDVNLTTGRIQTRDTLPYSRDTIGGRAPAARLAWDEIPAGIGAYDAENCIILQDKADAPVYLEILDDAIRVVHALELWGSGAREIQISLEEQWGAETEVLTIGPADENLVRFATVQHSEENAAGHSEFGAVWGSRNLKAIAVRVSDGVAVGDTDALLREVMVFGVARTSPAVGVLRETGDKEHRPVCSQACTFNRYVSSYRRTKDGRLAPSWRIGPIWRSETGKEFKHCDASGVKVAKGKKFEMFTEVSLGELCNDLDLEMWFRLVMQSWFVRYTELGVREIRAHTIAPDDAAWFEALMHELARCEESDAVAERAFTLERAMLARARRGCPLEESLAPHFNLPCSADGTLVDTAGYSQLLDKHYAARGWDLEFGWPQDQVQRNLGLDQVGAELDTRRDAIRNAA